MNSLNKFAATLVVVFLGILFASSARADCYRYPVVSVQPVAVVQTYVRATNVYATAAVVGRAPVVYCAPVYVAPPRPQNVFGFFDAYKAPAYRIDSGKLRLRY